MIPSAYAFVLYSLAALGAGSAFVVQALVAGFWSKTVGQETFPLAAIFATFFFSLGLGGIFGARRKSSGLSPLLRTSLLLSAWAGLALPLLKLGFARYGAIPALPIAIVLVDGILAGQLIPLTLKTRTETIRLNLALLFFVDHVAAVPFVTLFLYYLLPRHGYLETALYLASLVALATTVLCLLSRSFSAAVLIPLLAAAILPSAILRLAITSPLFTSPLSQMGASIVFSHQNAVEKIVLTEERDTNSAFPVPPRHTLYRNGTIAFSSNDEQANQMCLVNLPLAWMEERGRSVRHALVLGGGDGLAARNLLAFPRLRSLTVVDGNADLLELSRNELRVRMYNLDSLRNPKVRAISAEIFTWVKRARARYDLIVMDLPLSLDVTSSRLFSAEFYRAATQLLAPGGMLSLRAGPAFSEEDRDRIYLTRATSCVRETLASVGLSARIVINPRADQAFVLGAVGKLPGTAPTGGLSRFCLARADWRESETMPNTLSTLRLSSYAPGKRVSPLILPE